jgi:hypothetical protein
MKIKNPAIVAAIKKAAHTLNVSADEVLEYLLEDTAERMENNPIDLLTDIAHFVYETEAEAQTAAERIADLAISEALDGKTEITVDSEIVESEEGGYRVRVHELRPGRGYWVPAS